MDEGKKTILIVDDEKDLRTIVRLTLKTAGYAVHEAADGRQALEILQDLRPDLLVLDIMMPKMNGIEFCRRLIEKMGRKDIPILVLSGINENSQIVKEFHEMPFASKAFLKKPLETTELMAQIKRMIGPPTGASAAAAQAAAPKVTQPSAGPPANDSQKPASQIKVKPASQKTGGARHRYRVLVIDDEPDILTILKATLGMQHIVETAVDGMDALEKLDEFDPDFVLSDINMPVMDGLKTVEAIRKHPKYSDLPVFFLTGETTKDLARTAFGVGGNLFLRKPIDPVQLMKTIDYFVEEAKLTPRRKAQPKPGTEAVPKTESRAKAEPAAPAQAQADGSRVRVLTVDESPDSLSLLRRALPESAKAPYETLWSHSVSEAIGNLARWEPDVIFVNPRNLHMDGIAFVQSLKLKKLDKNFQIAFVGIKSFAADEQYSQRAFGRSIIPLTSNPAEAGAQLLGIIQAVKTPRPKKMSIVEIEKELERRRREESSTSERREKQRELFRQRFARVQQFIDANETASM